MNWAKTSEIAVIPNVSTAIVMAPGCARTGQTGAPSPAGPDATHKPALFYATVKTFVVLFIVAGGLCFAASRLAARSEG